MVKILLIEDDRSISQPLSLYIKKEGYDLSICHTGTNAVSVFQQEQPDLIILDINLPGKSGIDVCREIRALSDVSIIVLSARNSEEDKLSLFHLGADDYVAKPFSPRELMARISAIIKRVESRKQKGNGHVITLGDLHIDTNAFRVTRGDEEIRLTKTEFSILEYCANHSEDTIKRESIMREVMGYENYIYDRTLDTHIKNLRKKLESSITIETIRGIGYRVHIY